ncbi:MAG: OmpA family protein [Planctomycetes bacterium]|nr:OmpA family protein [Planctomycetota bacterium]
MFLSALALLLSAGCTTRYQDMLRERDARIRELNSDIARLTGENEDLMRREQAARSALSDATAQRPEPIAPAGEIGETQRLVGGDAHVSYRRGRLSIGVNDSVTFDSGSTALKPTAHTVLRNIAGVLKSQHAGKRLYIEGHTDSDPIVKTKDKYRSNRHLSVERADSVASYLIAQGVPESAIAVVGYGQFDPIGSNKAKNRRVEVVIGDPIR